MIRWTGLITESADLVAFAEDNARVLLPRAYLDECGCWADGILRGGALDVDKSWWIFAELDQLAGTLALRDPTFVRYLPRAYDYWFRYFVNPIYGEVWNGVDGRTHAPLRQLPKRSNGNGRTRIIPSSMRWLATLWRSSFTASL
jgi:hypothetical protein